MAHNFRVIESSSEFGPNGEPRFFAVCLETDHEQRMACYVSHTVSTAHYAFCYGLFHQKKERGTPTYQ